jgi:hypothetical protein
MIDKIKGKSLPVVEKYQKTLVSVEHVNEYGIDIIRITIDDPNTFDIDIDDVAAINEEILDLVNDDLPDGYYLEVTKLNVNGEDITKNEAISKHANWAEKFIVSKNPTKENIDEITRNAIGDTFAKILEQCGVFERNEEGKKQFLKFVETVNKQ